MNDREYNVGGMRLSRAFTMIEALVVTAILGVLASALVLSISSAARVWDHARAAQDQEAPIMLALTVFERDLRNSFPFFAAPFEGNSTAVAFAVRRAPPICLAETGEGTGGRIARVSYRYDEGHGVLFRREEALPSGPVREERLLGRLAGVQLRYGGARSSETTTEEWLDAWTSPSNSPERVWIQIGMATAQGEKKAWWERTLVIPVRGQ